jgi:hypothetical protein
VSKQENKNEHLPKLELRQNLPLVFNSDFEIEKSLNVISGSV